jgi:hypothetical protein
MGRDERTIEETPNINLETADNIKDFDLVYHDDEDVLFIRPMEVRPATSLDWEGVLWVRVDPVSGEIVGLEIDEFEGIFLKKYPELAKAWQEAKPLCNKRRIDKYNDPLWESFLTIIHEFFMHFFKDNPTQLAFGMAD